MPRVRQGCFWLELTVVSVTDCVCLVWLRSSALFSSLLSVMSSDLVCFSQIITCVVALFDGRRVVSVSSDMTLRVWDVDTGECVRQLKGHGGVSEC
jgi:WD40 repeat protein